MRKGFYGKILLKEYIKKANEEVFYNIKSLIDKKIYLEEKGYNFYCKFEIREDEDIINLDYDKNYDGLDYEDEETTYYLNIELTEDVFFKAMNKLANYHSVNDEKLGRSSEFKKLFNLEDNYFFHINDGESVFSVDLNYHDSIINYIEKLFNMEKMKERMELKMPERYTKEKVSKI